METRLEVLLGVKQTTSIHWKEGPTGARKGEKQTITSERLHKENQSPKHLALKASHGNFMSSYNQQDLSLDF